MLASGRGTAKDQAQAYKWLALAARQGQRDALKELPSVRKQMTARQITEGEKSADDFKPTPWRAGADAANTPGSTPRLIENMR